ncbi:hypothetical protein ACFYM2_19520 [Streptomyces sp. NPDC006711]|uniref:hypothetical protein n=1 Tax=unclassified Streptomyces TaxID=2593676 RepID=UPI0033D12E40
MKKASVLAATFLVGAASLVTATGSHAVANRPLSWDCTAGWVCMYAEHGGNGGVVASRKCGVIDIPSAWHGKIQSIASRAERFGVVLEHQNPDGTVTNIATLNPGDNLDLSAGQIAMLDFVYKVC